MMTALLMQTFMRAYTHTKFHLAYD